MKNRYPKDEGNRQKFSGSRSINKNKDSMKKKKNMRRMGGQGLSLEAFANAKSNSSYFNPALIKKQKEFYKNSKYVNKYKKSLKQQPSHPPLAIRPLEEDNETEDYRKKENETKNGSKKKENETENGSKKENETVDGDSKMSKNDKKRKRYGARSLIEVYEKNHEVDEKARMEREAMIQAKKEERENAEARRKAVREKMLKKTHKGQPLMKYRIHHLLETIQGSVNKT